jgi:alkylation response protein AidB-like acyl-CoA dehydrogenase
MSAIAAARLLAPTIEARAADTEALRTLPADLVDDIRRAGLFRIAVPAALGGLELDPVSIIEVVEEISRADGSTGWSTLIGNSVAFFAWLEPAVARSLLGDAGDAISTGVFGPLGRGRAAGDGTLVIDGRWPFNSGCRHATWYQSGFLAMAGDEPATRPDGRPDWRFAYYPATEAEVLDTWYTSGLRGTGSDDVVVHGLRLPEEHTAMPMWDPPRVDSPLLAIGFRAYTTTLLVGFPLGVARRALDEVVAVADGKRRWSGERSLAEDPLVQRALGRAEGLLRSARAYVVDAFGAAWDGVQARGEADDGERAAMLLATQQAMDAAVTAVDLVHPLVGSSTVLDGDPLGRCFRDLHAARQHVMFSGELFSEYGRDRLGIEPTPTVVRRALPAVA